MSKVGRFIGYERAFERWRIVARPQNGLYESGDGDGDNPSALAALELSSAFLSEEVSATLQQSAASSAAFTSTPEEEEEEDENEERC